MSFEDAGWGSTPDQLKERDERRTAKALRLIVIMAVLGAVTHYAGGEGLWVIWGLISLAIGLFTDWD